MAAAFIRSMGCVTPHGAGVAALSAAVAGGLRCPRRPDPVQLQGPTAAAGWIDPIHKPPLVRRRSPRPLRFGRLDRLSRLALAAAGQAIHDGAPLPAEDRAGVVWGTALGSHLTNEAFNGQLEQGGAASVSPALFTYTLPSAPAGEVSICFGLQNMTLTLSTGIGAGLEALSLAAHRVEQGKADCMVAGGGDTLSLASIRAAADGPLPSEGAAAFCLGAAADSALARVAGFGQAAGEDAPDRAAAEALDHAGVSRERLRRYFTCSPAAHPLVRELGQPLAAAPLLGICAALVHGPGALPLLAAAADPATREACAICLTPVVDEF